LVYDPLIYVNISIKYYFTSNSFVGSYFVILNARTFLFQLDNIENFLVFLWYKYDLLSLLLLVALRMKMMRDFY